MDPKQRQQAETMLQAYKELLAKHLDTPETIRQALLTVTDHGLWKDLAEFFQQENKDEALQYVLDAIHQQLNDGRTYLLPATAVIRPKAKLLDRVRAKIAPMATHRSNYADWMACRLIGPYETFHDMKCQLRTCLSDDTVLVWRFDYDGNNDQPSSKSEASRLVPPPPSSPDIMHVRYAYRPGALGILEIQVVEPIAACVFTQNSLNKHSGMKGCVTFKESKALYNDVKEAIVNGTLELTDKAEAAARDVVAYYQEQRNIKQDDTPLDLAALATLQALINVRFFLDKKSN